MHCTSDPTGDRVRFLAVGGPLIKDLRTFLLASKLWAAAPRSGGAANHSALPSPRAAKHCGDRHIEI